MDEMIKKMGACRYCGQTFMVDVDERIENLTPEQESEMLEEAATRACQCKEAKEYTGRKQSEECAAVQIKALFENDHQEMGEMLIAALPHIVKRKLKSVTVKAGEETVITAKVSMTGDGNIRATREDKATAAVEA